jgi:hypothetical protein
MDPAPARYMIRINGHLGATMLSAFPALAPRHHGAHTVLTGLLDQSALYGVLAEIEALGLDLLELRKFGPRPLIALGMLAAAGGAAWPSSARTPATPPACSARSSWPPSAWA